MRSTSGAKSERVGQSSTGFPFSAHPRAALPARCSAAIRQAKILPHSPDRLVFIVAVLFTVVSMFGCGAWDRTEATLTHYSRICVDGVEYLQFTSGASVAYKPDGSIKRCK